MLQREQRLQHQVVEPQQQKRPGWTTKLCSGTRALVAPRRGSKAALQAPSGRGSALEPQRTVVSEREVASSRRWPALLPTARLTMLQGSRGKMRSQRRRCSAYIECTRGVK